MQLPDDLLVVVDDVVADRVEHRERALPEDPRLTLQTHPGHPQLRAGSVTHLTTKFVPTKIAISPVSTASRSSTYQSVFRTMKTWLLGVALQLRTLMRGQRVLDRERVQVERGGNLCHLLLGRLVSPIQTKPPSLDAASSADEMSFASSDSSTRFPLRYTAQSMITSPL